jgi:integrase
LLAADQATTFLPTPKVPERPAELVRHRTLFTRFEIPFPLRVIGIRFRPNFDVPPNGDVADFHQAFPSRCTVDILLAHREYPLPVLVEKLRERKSEVDPLSLEEVRALLSAAKGQEHAIFTTLTLADLRPSELLALRRQDINFARGVIVVTRNLTRFGEGLPKTSYGELEVDMLAPVRVALAEQQARAELKSRSCFASAGAVP